jgi:hypothetical protein
VVINISLIYYYVENTSDDINRHNNDVTVDYLHKHSDLSVDDNMVIKTHGIFVIAVQWLVLR